VTTGTTLGGSLLVAAPTLDDPNFTRSVVLLLDHDADGALGVVLNRPSAISADDAIPQWASLASEPAVVHMGGPVTPEVVVCLGRLRREVAATGGTAVPGWTPLAGAVGAVDLDREPTDLLPAIEGLRLFAGYAGWGAGQLEMELRLGGWLVLPAEPDDAFTAAPESLWSRVLRRQGGDLALLHTMPVDPTQN
jgi:putative transcriptional regulator